MWPKIVVILILIMLVFGLLAACVNSVADMTAAQTATPTLAPTNVGPVDIAATMMQVEIASKATQQALSIQQTATQQVLGITATMQVGATQAAYTQQARVDAIATDQQGRRDAQATQARIDFEATQQQANRDAEATQAQARLDLQATQQAQATATAYMSTAAVLPTVQAFTATAISQEILLRNNEVELSNQHIRDQQMTTLVRNFLTPAVIIIAVVVLSLAIIRKSRSNIVTNEDGQVEMVIHDNTRLIRPRLMPGPVVEMYGNQTTMPMLVAPAVQAEVTKRAQGVDALSVMPSEPSRNGMDLYGAVFGNGGQQQARYEVLEGDVLPPSGLMDGEAVKAVEKDWNDEQQPL